MIDESKMLLVSTFASSEHIVDADRPDHTVCGRPLKGNGEYGHVWREDLKPELWVGDPSGHRQRTLADQRANSGHLITVCKRCKKKAGVS